MKKRLELNNSDELHIQRSSVARMECYPDKIEIELGLDSGFNELNLIWVNSNGTRKEHNFTSNVIIELLHDWDVICEDWIDESPYGVEQKLPLSDTISLGNKIDRKLGHDISIEFCKEIDLSKAQVLSVRFNEEYSRKYELVLKAPYIESNSDHETTRFYSGPFKIYSTKVRLIFD